MSTLKETACNAMIAIHRRTGEEWISLKSIYEEVESIRKEPNPNGGASIRALLERHCALSDVFQGEELFVLKEKGTGLYKYAYYDQIKFIEHISIGDIFTRDQLMAIFKISGQQGIMKTNKLNCLVLTTSEENGVYGDSSVENGFITYTGEGQVGDQTITGNNKTIYESNETGLIMYLFSKDNRRKYIFEGQVKLCDTPYQVKEPDREGNERLVWKFPLSIVYHNNYEEKNNEEFNKIVYEIKEIEDKVYSDMLEDLNDLEYREGKINIRKYRKTDRKITRTRKLDYIADEIIKTNQGIINEQVVYENELKRLMEEEAQEQVKLMQEFFNNKKENEGFDILSFELNEKGEYIEKYIEVKSTKGDEGTPIDITADEITFAKKHIDNYYLYRIINSDSKDRYLKIVKGRELFNNEDYNFVPTTYKIYSS